MNACVIFNPVARGDKARDFRTHLDTLAARCTLKPTTAPGAAIALATEAVRAGFDTLVAAGGDGTINEVVNGMAAAPDGLARARLGIVALGTANVFANELDLPLRLEPAWQVIEAGRTRWVDLGVAEFQRSGQTCRRYFVQLAGAGVDSRAIELVDWEQKKKIGKLAYVIAGCKALMEAKASIRVSDGQQTLSAEQVLIGNGRFYGGRMKLFPNAKLDDGVLDVTLIGRASLFQLARGGLAMLAGRLEKSSATHHLQGPSFTMESSGRVALHLEGDNVGQLPVQFSVRPKGLQVIIR